MSVGLGLRGLGTRIEAGRLECVGEDIRLPRETLFSTSKEMALTREVATGFSTSFVHKTKMNNWHFGGLEKILSPSPFTLDPGGMWGSWGQGEPCDCSATLPWKACK